MILCCWRGARKTPTPCSSAVACRWKATPNSVCWSRIRLMPSRCRCSIWSSSSQPRCWHEAEPGVQPAEPMAYRDLRDFIAQLEQWGELRRVQAEVSPYLEMTALCDRSLRAGGPALLFEHPTGHSMPVLGNLFGTTRRVALGMGVNDVSELRQFGQLLATLKEPEAPKGFKELIGLRSMVKTLWNMA